MPFALTTLTRGAFVELLDAAIEGTNFFLARELRGRRWRPRAFVPAGKNQMRPFLILRVRDCEQLHAGVRMIARGRTRRAERRGRFLKPAQKESARKFHVQTLRPIARNVFDFERVLLPTEKRERGMRLL